MDRPNPLFWSRLQAPAAMAGWAVASFLVIRFQSQIPFSLGPRWLLAGAFGLPLLAHWLGGWRATAAVFLAALAARGDGTYSAWETIAGIAAMHGGGLLYLACRSFRTLPGAKVERPADVLNLIVELSGIAIGRGLVSGLAGAVIDPATAVQAAAAAAAVTWLALALCVPTVVAFRTGAFPTRKDRYWPVEGTTILVGLTLVSGTLFGNGLTLSRDIPLPVVVLLAVFGTWVAFRFDVLGTALGGLVIAGQVLGQTWYLGLASPLTPSESTWQTKDTFLVLLTGIHFVQLVIASAIREWKAQTAGMIRLNEELAAANRSLANQQAWLDAVFAHLPVGVYVIDKDAATIRSINPSFEIPGLDPASLDHSPEDLSRRNSILRTDGRKFPVEDWPILRALRRGEVVVGERMWIRNPAGNTLVAINAAPIRNGAGEISGAVAVTLDLTRQEEATRVIRDGEDRLKFALQSAGMITWDLDLETGRVIRSESFREWLGLPPADEDLTAEEFLSRVHPDDRDRVRDAIPRIRQPDGDRVEYRVLREDGTVAWLSSSGRPITGPDGRIVRVVGVHRDVTAERTSRDRLLLLESAVVHAHDAVVILDGSPTPGSGRCVLYVNDAFCKMTGYDREDVIGRTLHVLRGPASDPATLDTLRAALDAGQSLRVELLNYRKDGTAYWVDLALEPVRDGGRLTHWVMIQRDVTRRRRAEDLLRESEAKFRGIFENAWAGVSITDASGVFVSVNPALTDLLGRRAEDVLGHSPQDFTHPEDWARQEPYSRAVRAGERDRYQVRKRYLKPDGTIVWTELWFAAIRGPGGEYRSGLGISVDVTDRLRLEEQLRQAQKMEAFGQLAGGVAHDFNNLLTAVLGNLSLIRLPAGDPNRSLVSAAETAGTRAADLTRKLLGYARRTNLYLSPVPVGDVIDEVVDILRRTFDPRIVIRTDVGTVPAVRADATLLNQVLINLCLNSRDAIDGSGEVVLSADGVEFSAEAVGDTPDARPGSFVRVSVRDTGRGMDEDVRRRIFEPFFTTKAIGQGTGLGLAMVHGIMKQHGGWVSCESAAGVGTRFDLYFPVPQEAGWSADPLGGVSPSSATPVRSPATVRTVPDVPRTVLLVDDESMIRILARTVLEAGGYTVVEAEDGVEAVEKFRQAPDTFDLVILDLTMPRMSGRDACRQMTALWPAARILLSSGYSADDISDLDGAVGMLTKPYRPDNLLAAVRKALTRDHAEAGSVQFRS